MPLYGATGGGKLLPVAFLVAALSDSGYLIRLPVSDGSRPVTEDSGFTIEPPLEWLVETDSVGIALTVAAAALPEDATTALGLLALRRLRVVGLTAARPLLRLQSQLLPQRSQLLKTHISPAFHPLQMYGPDSSS